MSQLIASADDAASVSIGKLTVENGTDQIALHESLDQAAQCLESEKGLRDAQLAPAISKTVKSFLLSALALMYQPMRAALRARSASSASTSHAVVSVML